MFSIDSKFYTLSNYVYHLFLINILFLLTSLLIVSIPASITALVSTVRELNNPKIVSRYFQNLRKYWLKSLPLGIFNLFSILFVQTISQITISNSLFLRGVIYVFLIFLLSYNLNLYIVLIMEKEIIHYYDLFQRCFMWSIGVFYRLFLLFLFVGVINYFILLRFPALILLFGASLPIYFYVRIFDKIIEKNRVKEEWLQKIV